VTREAFRWAVCAIIVVAAHAFAWQVLSTQEPASESDAGSPIVTLELSPVVAAPAPPPEEPAPEAQLNEALNAPAPPIDAAPPTNVQPPPTPEDPRPAKSDPQPAKSDPPPPEPEVPPDPAASPPQVEGVTAKPPPPETPTPPPSPPPSPPLSAPSAAMPTVADVAAAPETAPGSEEAMPPAAIQRWRQALIAQIERHKRFPANAKGRSGVVRVAFSIDRDGRLTEVRVLASSGAAALDEAAIDLIRQSQPFPTPPSTLPENDLSFVAPIRYLPSGSY
jgi:periplasmic protein TonB